MKKWKRNLLIIGVIGVITAAGVIYYASIKPPTAKDSEPVASFHSITFIDSLYNDTALAKKLDGKNIAISGNIKEINEDKLIIDAGGTSCLVCTFDSADFVNVKTNYKVGKPIVIKGIFYGYNKIEDDGMSLIPEDKTAYLKTCYLNN
jgi:hypothetical protein